MLNRSASLAMSTRILKALPGKPDIKRHSPSILYESTSSLFLTRIAKLEMPQRIISQNKDQTQNSHIQGEQ